MTDERPKNNPIARLSRRQFLRWVGAGAAASVLAASGLGLLRPLSADARVQGRPRAAHGCAAHAVRPRGGDPL